jgi:hypothetical protein
MDLRDLSDRARLRLAVVGVVVLVVVAAMAAAALRALGQSDAAGAALGISVAAMVPALVGSAVLFPSAGRRLRDIAPTRPVARLATLLRSRMTPAHS